MEKDGYGYVCSKIRAPEINSIRNERQTKERGKELIITKHQITSEITVEQPLDSLTIFFFASFARALAPINSFGMNTVGCVWFCSRKTCCLSKHITRNLNWAYTVFFVLACWSGKNSTQHKTLFNLNAFDQPKHTHTHTHKFSWMQKFCLVTGWNWLNENWRFNSGENSMKKCFNSTKLDSFVYLTRKLLVLDRKITAEERESLFCWKEESQLVGSIMSPVAYSTTKVKQTKQLFILLLLLLLLGVCVCANKLDSADYQAIRCRLVVRWDRGNEHTQMRVARRASRCALRPTSTKKTLTHTPTFASISIQIDVFFVCYLAFAYSFFPAFVSLMLLPYKSDIYQNKQLESLYAVRTKACCIQNNNHRNRANVVAVFYGFWMDTCTNARWWIPFIGQDKYRRAR